MLATLEMKSTELLCTARLLPPRARKVLGMEELLEMVRQCTSIHNGARPDGDCSILPGLVPIWREPMSEVPFQSELDRYVAWMPEREAFSPSKMQQ